MNLEPPPYRILGFTANWRNWFNQVYKYITMNDKPFSLRVVAGEVAGYSVVSKFGSIDDVGSTVTPICSSGRYDTPSAVVALEIVSADANDTSAGTGARSVKITGIGAGWVEKTETATMNGITAVSIGNWFRVYRVQVIDSGSYADATTASHAGQIDVQVSGGGTVWASIEEVPSGAGNFPLSQSQIGAFTLPINQTGYVYVRKIVKESAKNPNVFFFSRERADEVSAPYGPMQVKSMYRNIDSDVDSQPFAPLGPFVGPCDLGFMASVSSTTADVTVEFEIVCVAT